jgi:hypothetical protein
MCANLIGRPPSPQAEFVKFFTILVDLIMRIRFRAFPNPSPGVLCPQIPLIIADRFHLWPFAKSADEFSFKDRCRIFFQVVVFHRADHLREVGVEEPGVAMMDAACAGRACAAFPRSVSVSAGFNSSRALCRRYPRKRLFIAIARG